MQITAACANRAFMTEHGNFSFAPGLQSYHSGWLLEYVFFVSRKSVSSWIAVIARALFSQSKITNIN